MYTNFLFLHTEPSVQKCVKLPEIIRDIAFYCYIEWKHLTRSTHKFIGLHFIHVYVNVYASSNLAFPQYFLFLQFVSIFHSLTN